MQHTMLSLEARLILILKDKHDLYQPLTKFTILVIKLLSKIVEQRNLQKMSLKVGGEENVTLEN